MTEIIVVLDNIRSTYNVGSILRSADGFGVTTVLSVGVTPHFKQRDDSRLPHVIARAEREISKTALDAQVILRNHFETADQAIAHLVDTPLVALELTPSAVDLRSFTPPKKFALVVGNEINGVSQEFLNAAVTTIFIPMRGQKESYNVAVSTAVALYQLCLC